LADATRFLNGSEPFPMITSVAGINLFVTGAQAKPLSIPQSGTFGLSGFNSSAASQARYNAMQQILTFDHEALLVNAASDTMSQAITNSTSPSDAYIYFLPLNTSLPGGSQPTCNTCLKNTMQVYEAASADRTSAIAGTYVDAATQVNVQCGPGFVNQSLAAAAVTGAAGRGIDVGFGGNWALLIVLWTMVMGWLV